MKFTFVAVSVPALKQVTEFKKRYTDNDLNIDIFYIAGEEMKYLADPERLIESVKTADVAVIDTMGASEKFQEIVREGLKDCKGERIVIGNALREYIKLGSFSMGSMSKMMKKSDNSSCVSDKKTEEEKGEKKKSTIVKMHRMRRMALIFGNILPFGITKDMKNVFTLIDYWQQAGEEDITSFMHLILRRYMGKKNLPKEKLCTMEYGIYVKHIGEKKADGKKKTVALFFYGHSYPNDFMPVVKNVKEKLEKDFNILPVAFSQEEDSDFDNLENILKESRTHVAAVINFMPFRLGAGPMGGDADRAVNILKKLNVPYFKPFALTKVNEEEWERAGSVNPGEFLISIMLPELDGGLLTFPVGVMERKEPDEYGLALPEIKVIEERTDALCERVRKYICLREKENSEKKVAIVVYNYPPGENNVMRAAFLDTVKSLSAFVTDLKNAGYITEEISAEELEEAFIYSGRCNGPLWQDEKEEKIKGITLGNVYICLQPAKEEEYHDRNSIPHKDYIALYHFLKDDFKADAVIHFGTHGTLEFMQGKDNGMTGNCWPDKLINSIPSFYYYYIGNPSEAVIAKRRIHACLISYEAPPFVKAGLYGSFEELKETISEYREALQVAPERALDILENIKKIACECGFNEENIDELDERLYEYDNSLITSGLHEISEGESRALLRALNGEYIEAGPGGDVIKNPHILPSGRNIVQFDPRLVPTRTAYERGAKAAEELIKSYVKEKGQYPESTAVILWGLETSRSMGETVGQIMYYLGIRLKSSKGSFDDRFEVIPYEELKRPRIDVIIHMCGFFRDMYPNIIDNLNYMMQEILKLDEEKNYYRIHTLKLMETESPELASCRIFGPKDGEYGTRLTDIVRNGSWNKAEEIGAAFTDDLSYAYTFKEKGIEAKELLKKEYSKVKYISQVRNNPEYELTDLDHYYEFYGGLSKALENVNGEKPLMMVADTTGEEVKTEGIEEALKRGIDTRLLNPLWIEGMMKHSYHGVQQIEKRFENVMGFAATTDAVSSSTFSNMTKCYAGNEELRKRMQKCNRFSYMKMMERLMEANNRGYFNADEEELEMIQEAYLEAEGDAEN